jgi:hypothetical protein
LPRQRPVHAIAFTSQNQIKQGIRGIIHLIMDKDLDKRGRLTADLGKRLRKSDFELCYEKLFHLLHFEGNSGCNRQVAYFDQQSNPNESVPTDSFDAESIAMSGQCTAEPGRLHVSPS